MILNDKDVELKRQEINNRKRLLETLKDRVRNNELIIQSLQEQLLEAGHKI